MTHPKAIVVWEDIQVLDCGGWVDKPGPHVWVPYIVEQMGFILYDGPEGVVLTDSISPDAIGPRTQIPRGCIRQVTVESPILDSKPKKSRRASR